MTTPTPWASEPSFDDDFRAALAAERGGDGEPMRALLARMRALDERKIPYYPGHVPDAPLSVGRSSPSLTAWTEREEQARKVVRRESRKCGCTLHRNSADEVVRVDPACGALRRCTDEPWQRAHVQRGVALEDSSGQKLWSWLSRPPAGDTGARS